ncbi:MAG TPA: glycosyltransferase family 4 protein [Planctomycetaceae bacterium]|nr:glycosyltransferase family 4 protein [Planctomycetaceae bacterium]
MTTFPYPFAYAGGIPFHGAAMVAASAIESSPRRTPEAQPRIDKVRVLHLINGEHYAGAERVQDLLALRLPAQGVEAGFVCVKPNRFAAARKSQSTPLFNAPMGFRGDPRPIAHIARLIREHGYQVLHTHTVRTAMIGRCAALLAGVPMVHHMHCQTSVEVDRHVFNWMNARLEGLCLTGVSAIIAVSDSIADYMRRQGLAGSHVHVVPNGVPGQPQLPARSAPTGTWTIGTIAMFRPRKGLETLIDAVALLHEQGLPVRLKAVGRFETPQYEGDVHEHVHRRGLDHIVEWAGFRSDVPAAIAEMDVMVLPSLVSEGMPMVVLEAFAAGTPAVGSRVPGITDVIRDHIDGLLAEPGDCYDLARALGRLMRNPLEWSHLRQAAFERHAEQYTDARMAEGVAEVYRQVLARR